MCFPFLFKLLSRLYCVFPIFFTISPRQLLSLFCYPSFLLSFKIYAGSVSSFSLFIPELFSTIHHYPFSFVLYFLRHPLEHFFSSPLFSLSFTPFLQASSQSNYSRTYVHLQRQSTFLTFYLPILRRPPRPTNQKKLISTVEWRKKISIILMQ